MFQYSKNDVHLHVVRQRQERGGEDSKNRDNLKLTHDISEILFFLNLVDV